MPWDDSNDESGAEGDGDAAGASAEHEVRQESCASDRGGCPVALEDKVFTAMNELVDKAHGMIIQQQIAQGCATLQQLQHHVNSIFTGNTEESTRMKLADWMKYCHATHQESTRSIADVQWPPSCDTWVIFLLETRPMVGSYKRFLGVIGNVVEVATRYWSKQLNKSSSDLSPMKLYSAMHFRTIATLKRQYGMGVTQVEGITMQEARNAMHFGDIDSVSGVAALAAFTMGVSMGGRRPRTLTAMKLAHIKLTAGDYR